MNTPHPAADHRAAAADQRATCCVLTVSDTRTPATDTGGDTLANALVAAGHRILHRQITPDDPDPIRGVLTHWLTPTAHHVPPQAIFTTGGTGIARRDTTVEIAREFIDKELEGFGELFRMLSYEQVGPAAMLSRAVAGLAGETLLFTLPGSVNAVTLAMEKLIVPELPHLVWERSR